MMEEAAGTAQAIDRYLALALCCVKDRQPLPEWPADWAMLPDITEIAVGRITFHGLALALLSAPCKLSGWPAPVREALGGEARAQSFWELGHRGVLVRLIDALGSAGIDSTVTKGSALAYSLYSDPAWRRRGDSDLLVGQAPREAVRRALRGAGFQPLGDARPLQECWASSCAMGFEHVFDLHWRINASALLTERLGRAGIGNRWVPLPRLSPTARGIAPPDNLILVAINRASHEHFGYRSGETKQFDQDRLIWALDFDLLCTGFGPADWDALCAAAAASGTGQLVAAALEFAAATLGTPIPQSVRDFLAAQPRDPQLASYFGKLSGFDRLRRDLAASPGLAAKLHLIGYTLLPGAEVLHERFPDATHWPLPALRARRLVSGAGKLIRRAF